MLTWRSHAAIRKTMNTRGRLEHDLLMWNECRQESTRVLSTSKETRSITKNTGREGGSKRCARAAARETKSTRRERRIVEHGLLSRSATRGGEMLDLSKGGSICA